jgi:transglutaminase-like putative cysteine protease
MLKSLPLLAVLLAFFCAVAAAAPGDIEEKIPLPFGHPTGVAWTGSTLWVADRRTDLFYEVDPVSGSVLREIESPAWFPSGLAWDGSLLWSTDPGAGAIYATDPGTGHTVRTLESPTPSPTGIAWDGDALWICDNRNDRILNIDPADGTTIVSFRSPATDPRSIVFGNGYLWCSDRIRDCIYMIDPVSGMVVQVLDAPGSFTWGLAWKDGFLLNADYQDDTLYRIVAVDDELYRTSDPRNAIVDFTTEAVAIGTGNIEKLDIFYAVPSDRPGQKILADLTYRPEPIMKKDRWDQKIAAFSFEGLEPGESIEVTMKAAIEASSIRYFIRPDKVGKKIPRNIREKYLADDIKYDITHPYIQGIVDEVVGDEDNLYWKARKLYQYLIANMEYKLAGGWNTAPTVLERRNGSCSEYTFSFIALCRAAGVPARYVGSLVVRGDDASYDDVFHRWNEIYLPGYGWVPVDASRGDRDLPADQGAAFGGISNRFLITTEGAGGSEYLGWSYNHENRWVSSGKCTVRMESIAEWEPLEDTSEDMLIIKLRCGDD